MMLIIKCLILKVIHLQGTHASPLRVLRNWLCIQHCRALTCAKAPSENHLQDINPRKRSSWVFELENMNHIVPELHHISVDVITQSYSSVLIHITVFLILGGQNRWVKQLVIAGSSSPTRRTGSDRVFLAWGMYIDCWPRNCRRGSIGERDKPRPTLIPHQSWHKGSWQFEWLRFWESPSYCLHTISGSLRTSHQCIKNQ